MNNIKWSWDSFTLGLFAGIILIIIVACIFECKYNDIKKIFKNIIHKKEEVNDTEKIIINDNTIGDDQFNFKEVLYKNLICPCCLTDCTKNIDTENICINSDMHISIIDILDWNGSLNKAIRLRDTYDDIHNKFDYVKIKSSITNSNLLNRKWGRAYLKCDKCNSSWLSEPFLIDTVPDNTKDEYNL